MTQQEQAAEVLRLVDVRKVYGFGHTAVTALDGISMSFAQGSFTAIMGPSGSGKSTLLQCAAGLTKATSGGVWLGGLPIDGLDEKRLAELRRDRIGFVFQSFNLLPALTVRENVTLPFRLGHRKPNDSAVDQLLRFTGIADHAHRRPNELSGGQQQRVAICRALAHQPECVFADEPTGNLDLASSNEILHLLRGVVRDLGHTVFMVTHDPVAASYADSVVFLADGRIVDIAHGLSADKIAGRLAQFGRR
ncbi:ABC transporter ATP-binding protein [Spongiactinospora sp. 9N601]|uniref:ABC transporter ATP-binding protein n=1 Tax=Spongiactinospora sp. 9N601 TaxID=3375149 RepID=UPI0037949F23